MLELAYPLSETVEINGVEYSLNLSFDNVLRLIDLLNDDEVSEELMVYTGIEMLIGVRLDDPIEEQAEILTEVFKNTVGKEQEDNVPLDIEGNPMPVNNGGGEKVYSIKEDADYIFASFYQDYGIDLIEQQGKLHWHKFNALLSGLRKDTRFKEVLEIRTMELPTGTGMTKQRENIRKMKKQYALKGDK